MKKFDAHFPAVTNPFTKKKFPAETITFTMSDDGKWSCSDFGPMIEVDVIDRCKKATNWAEIKATHFPMVGFHS